MVNNWGTVDIPTAGVDARDTDALECLFALCRIMGLRYKIEKLKGGTFSVGVAWSDWPTDFFEPRKRDGKIIIVGATNPVQAFRSAINSAVIDLIRNGNSFGSFYKEYWRRETGEDW